MDQPGRAETNPAQSHEVHTNEVITLLVTEWLSLREEAARAIERRVTLLAWGTTVLTALFSGVGLVLLQYQQTHLAYWGLVGFIPSFTAVLAGGWAGESMRAGRAGQYASWIERDLDQLLPEISDQDVRHSLEVLKRSATRPRAVLGWETYLRVPVQRHGFWKTSQMEFPYWTTAASLVGVTGVALVASTLLSYTQWGGYTPRGPLVVAVLAAIYYVALFRWIRRVP